MEFQIDISDVYIYAYYLYHGLPPTIEHTYYLYHGLPPTIEHTYYLYHGLPPTIEHTSKQTILS